MQVNLLPKIRNLLISKKNLEARRDALSATKAIKASSSALAIVALAFSVLYTHEGRYLSLLGCLPMAYGSYEISALAENLQHVLENPVREFQAVCAKFHSDKDFIRFMTTGAPLTRAIALRYLEAVEKEAPPPPRFSLSRIWRSISA